LESCDVIRVGSEGEKGLEWLGETRVGGCLGYAEAGVVGDLKVGDDRVASEAGDGRTEEKTELEATDDTVDMGRSEKVLMNNSEGEAEQDR
jgi:hypothetical protein